MSHHPSRAIDPLLLGPGSPDRPKIALHLYPDPVDTNSLDVLLSVPLDPRLDEDAALIQDFGTHTLDVHYSVRLNLANERKALASKLLSLYNSPEGGILRQDPLQCLTQEQLRKVLCPLADQGWSIFHRLFDIREPRGFSRSDGPRVAAGARKILDRGHPWVIKVLRGNELLFPWAFLFDDERFSPTNLSTLDPSRFLGFRCEIQEDMETLASRIKLPSSPSIVAAICPQVDGGRHHAPDHPLQKSNVTLIPVTSAPDLGDQLADFNGDCLYFYGHSQNSSHSVPHDSWVQLNGVKLSVTDLDSRYCAPRFHQDLVVAFLNGCRTSPLGQWNDSSVVGFLCRHGDHRLCCVATVAEVPQSFAAEFARHFWDAFLLQGQPIGQSLLFARRTMLQQKQNPLGLVYTLFGRVDTRLESTSRSSAS